MRRLRYTRLLSLQAATIVIFFTIGCAQEINSSVPSVTKVPCSEIKPSNFLPASNVVELSVAPNHSKKYWRWQGEDYTKDTEVSRQGYLYAFDSGAFPNNAFCVQVDKSAASSLGNINVPIETTHLLIKDSNKISFEGINELPNLKSIFIVRTPVEDIFSPPPRTLNDMIFIESSISPKDVENLPVM